MDEPRLETLGLKPIEAELATIAALKDKRQIAALIAHYNQVSVTAPYDFGVHQDARDSTKYIVDLGQSGLGLPDRDYYLKDDDAKLKDARVKYQAHVGKMLAMSGDHDAAANARRIVALETELARVQWTKVQNRDPVKTYNRVELAPPPKRPPPPRRTVCESDLLTVKRLSLQDTQIAARWDQFVVRCPEARENNVRHCLHVRHTALRC